MIKATHWLFGHPVGNRAALPWHTPETMTNGSWYKCRACNTISRR